MRKQGTRDLGDLFEEGLRKERERMIALIKEAYWLAYEGMADAARCSWAVQASTKQAQGLGGGAEAYRR